MIRLERLKNRLAKKVRRAYGAVRRLLGIKYRSPLSEADLFEILRGRSVALIGNARTLADGRYGSQIDEHDIVIRCNRAPIPGRESHGSRTTFIATSTDLPRELMAERAATYLLWMSPRRDALAGWMLKWPNFFLYPENSHARLQSAVAPRPTTGIMVIDLLVRSPCRSITLYGFDFFKSRSLSGDRSREGSPHDFDAEEAFVRQLVDTDTRVSLVSLN